MIGHRRQALITGAMGQLGRELVQHAPEGWSVLACSSADLDVTQPDMVRRVIGTARPDVIIQAAAYTAVDAAEADPAAAELVNSEGAANVARAAAEVGARVIQVSTDYVFDGTRSVPCTPADAPSPLGVYGRTKLSGEREVMRILGDRAVVVRTAWLYASHGRNFVLTMLRLMRERSEVGVVADQVGTPTWARSLARVLWAVAGRPAVSGIHHWTDAGVASWYDFAVAIQEEALALGLLDRAVPVKPLLSSQLQTAARRPAFSVLDKTATWSALELPPQHWRVNLRLMLQELPRA